MDPITHRLTAGVMDPRHSEFNRFWYPVRDPKPISALPPRSTHPTLALKLFRREPAITGFD